MQYHNHMSHFSVFNVSTGTIQFRDDSIRPPSAITPRETRSVLSALGSSVEHYFSSGLAPSTKKVYSAAITRYTKFCNQFLLNTYPTSEQTLCRFVTYLAMDHVSTSSLSVYFMFVAVAGAEGKYTWSPILFYIRDSIDQTSASDKSLISYHCSGRCGIKFVGS